jgi:hypothetical protein
MRKPAKKKRYVRLYTDVIRNRYWKVEFSDGAKTIPVSILMTTTSLACNKRGDPFECVLAHGIEDFVKLQPEKFPHPVLYAYVTRSAVYLIDRIKDGQPSHAVRYMHGFSKWTETFDMMTKAQFAAKYDGVGFVMNLSPGRKYRQGESTEGGNGTGGSRSHKVHRGAMERAIAAGFVPQTSADV